MTETANENLHARIAQSIGLNLMEEFTNVKVTHRYDESIVTFDDNPELEIVIKTRKEQST